MANAVRPPLRATTIEQQRRTRLSLSPAAVRNDDNSSLMHNQHHHQQQHHQHSSSSHTAVSTRQASKAAVKQLPSAPARHGAAPARSGSRKRSATGLDDATAPDTRPPTKVTVTQPHGELVRITNGVHAPLGIDADDVRSGTSTPRPGSAGKLAPSSQAQAQDKRSLRSHDGGSRLKSDLATYFASYDDIIAGVPKPEEFLDYDTPVFVLDEPLKSKTAPAPVSPAQSRASLSPTRSRKRKASLPSAEAPAAPSLPPPAQSSTAFHALDYASISKHLRDDTSAAAEDPLADSFFFTQHRRAERKEKQLRNIEKERAMHEKVQLERLLDGLQGPDWLKVMGITGVTDGERKDWEPKRDFFVKEVEALVDKFRVWKEEEKRLRAEKEAALAAEEEDEEESESEASEAVHDNGTTNNNRTKSPTATKPPAPRKPPRPHGFLLPLMAPEPLAPFQSFFAKPHLRAAALGKHRHGRNALAFGLPIPEFEEHEFEIPDDYIDPLFLRDIARQRRRRKRERESTGNGKEAAE